MRYGSVCSGIEAATVAWHPLGWLPAWFSEIDAFPCALLAHHYPSVPNLGDMTAIRGRTDLERIDLLVGGTPCQSFSVAGLRKGLDDPRGNLALVFLGIADALRPRWVVFENVPGVLSSGGGRDFGAFLGGLAELGYGFAYRVLDAQFVRVQSHPRAVPQRRRRVFVVGHLGDWRRAAAVLLERESLCGHPAPSREAGQGVAAKSLRGATGGIDREDMHTLITQPVANPLTARMHKGVNTTMDEGQTMVAHSLRAEGHDASEDGTGRGTPLVFDPLQVTAPLHRLNPETDVHPTMHSQPHAVAFQTRIARNGRGQPKDVTDALTSCAAGTHADSKPHVAYSGGVRRLTPGECEKLQGFPPGYTAIPYRGKPAADAPRYKALGNSMAVNVMSWIGQRIQLCEESTHARP